MKPEIQPGALVQFVGPLYEGYGPHIGQRGEVTERTGATLQRADRPGEAPVELVVVKFFGHRKPSVIGLNRLEAIAACKG